MNRILLSFLFVLGTFISFSQTDTVIVEKSKTPKFLKRDLKAPKDRISLDLLGTNWIHNIPNFKAKWYSRGLNVAFMWDFRFKKSNVSFAPGIGFSTSNIYHNTIMMVDSNGIRFDPNGRTVFDTLGYNADRYKVNKISLNYIEIPIELRFRTRPDRLDQVWKFNVGFKFGVRIDSHTKYSIKEASGTKVYKEKRFPDFNLFRMGPTLRIGYSSFNIFGFYSILGVFKADRGPKANEFAVGISFNGL